MGIDCTNEYISDEQLIKELLVVDNDGNVNVNEHRVTGTITPLPDDVLGCIHQPSLSELLRMLVVDITGERKIRTVAT